MNRDTAPRRLFRCLFVHSLPFLLVFGVKKLSGLSGDPYFVYFSVTFVCRYFRTVVMAYGNMKYKAIPQLQEPTLKPGDVTMIIPTVSVLDNPDFEKCLTTLFLNFPKKIIISTDSEARSEAAERRCGEIRAKIQDGTSPFLGDRGATNVSSVLADFTSAGEADKRKQMEIALGLVDTELAVFADDHVFFKREFLSQIIAPFEKPEIALVGTAKRACRKALGAWSWAAFFNFLGHTYLLRHTYENRSTVFMDGGSKVISGRAFAIRTKVIRNKEFFDAFTNQVVPFTRGVRVMIGDDNFITDWNLERGYDLYFQDTEDATIETTLGEAETWVRKCLRWRRTTIYFNISTLSRSTVWLRWPWTVWLTYIPELFNLALAWDGGMVYLLGKSRFGSALSVCCLGMWIVLTKLIKLLPHFRLYPGDLKYFPAYVGFGYFHSLLTVKAYLTFAVQDWEGRKFEPMPHA